MKLPKKPFGFTLIELLVAGTVSLVLALTLFQVFVHSGRSVTEATEKLSLMSKTRIPLDRASLYLSSSIKVPGEENFLFPTSEGGQNEFGTAIDPGDASTWNRYVVFRTGEDFLSAGFDPDQIMDPTHYSTNGQLSRYRNYTHEVFDYIMWFEDDSVADHAPNVDKALCLARIKPLPDPSNPGRFLFRDEAWAKNNPWADIDTTVRGGGNNYVLVLARECKEITFRRVGAGAFEMSALAEETVHTTGGPQVKQFRTSSFIQVPSLSE